MRLGLPERLVAPLVLACAVAWGLCADGLCAEPLVFPQIADGGGYRTAVLLTNGSSTSTSARISFFDNDGNAMAVTVAGTTGASFDVQVPAGGAARLETAGTGPTAMSGWASVTTTPSAAINGNAVFQLYEGTRIVCEASVPAAVPSAGIEFFVDEENGFNTAFAMVNPGAAAAVGTVILTDLSGKTIGTAPVSLGPGRHTAVFLWQLFPSAPSGRAELRLASGAAAVTALRYSNSGVFSSATVGTPGASAGSVAALFSPGGGVRSRLVAEIGRATATIDLAIYSFTANELREALIAAKNRGVSIRIVADSSQATGLGGEIPTLESLGFSLKRLTGLGSGIMHNKYMIIDRKLLFTGSYNWSVSAEDSNFENLILLEGLPVIRDYEADFTRLWSR